MLCVGIEIDFAFKPTAYIAETPIPAVCPIPTCCSGLKYTFLFAFESKLLVLSWIVKVLLTSAIFDYLMTLKPNPPSPGFLVPDYPAFQRRAR